MQRLLLLIAALALFAAACAGATVEESFEELPGNESPPETSTSVAPPDDVPGTEDASSEYPPADEPSNQPPEGPDAPDFTLALEPSGEFVLSQEVKPVYLIFWAEW